MNINDIKYLTFQIKDLEKQLELAKAKVLEEFRNMSEADRALCENVVEDSEIKIQYFPPSTSTSVDTAKLKKDGLYDQYSKTSQKKDYIKVNIK